MRGYAEVAIEAINPPKILKHQLGMGDDAPCLKLTRVTTSGSRTVSFANLYHSDNSFKLTGKLLHKRTTKVNRLY
ncbi:UTRA domain-containing protein [Pseudoalteromonas qingdaonensis]|uniref:UTRA domain-containing protein n=1 Tax=Pseudoalteromonas qingdaonensis TaxID=3131913 RepID=UPI003CCC2242